MLGPSSTFYLYFISGLFRRRMHAGYENGRQIKVARRKINLREEGWWISEDPSEGVHQGNVFVHVSETDFSILNAHAVTVMRYLVPDP